MDCSVLPSNDIAHFSPEGLMLRPVQNFLILVLVLH